MPTGARAHPLHPRPNPATLPPSQPAGGDRHDPSRRLERVRPRARERHSSARIYPDGIHAAIAAALNADDGIDASDRHPRPARERPPPRPAQGHRRPPLVGPQGPPQGRRRHRRPRRPAGPRGHGPHRPPLRALLEDLQAPDGHPLLPPLARGRRARAPLGHQPLPPDPRRPRRPHRAPERGDVRRALPRPRAARDHPHLLVRGRRGLPLRPDLPARRRPHLLLPPRPRDLPHLPRPHRPAGSSATPSTGPTTPPPPGPTSPRARTSPSTRPPRRSPRRAPPCTSPARRATGDRRPSGAKRLLILGTGAIARTHAEKFALIPGCELVAAVDMNAERARDFAAAHAIPNAFGSLADAIAWGEFDAAVNSTPDPAHHPTTMRAHRRRQARLLREAPRPQPRRRHGDDRGRRGRRPRQHGQPHLPQRQRPADRPPHDRGRRDRRGPPRPGQLPPVLAHRPPLGRLAHRGALALAALLPARLQGGDGRHRRPHPRLRHLRHRPRHHRPLRPDEDLRQGRRRRHRRLHPRRQRQRRHDGRILQRRPRRRPHEPLRHRQAQRPRPPRSTATRAR